MEKWLIVADDVTGALDSAVGFAAAGTTRYGTTAPLGVDVATISSGTRADAQPPSTLPTPIHREQVDRLFIKIDSTLRGWPVEDVKVAMGWWHPGATAVICPAAPAIGRTVEGGRVFVQGEPASRSAASLDPVAPLVEDSLPTLFDAPLIDIVRLPEAIGREPVVIVDASTDKNLNELATVLLAAGPRAVPVGSSGLAAALGSRYPQHAVQRPSVDGVTVVITSVHPVSLGQIAALEATVVPIVSAPQLASASITHDQAKSIARETASRAQQLILDHPRSAVIAIGGDGTDALLAALGADGVEVMGSLLPGIPWGRIRGGAADGTIIATKSGGFGTPDTLTELIRILTEENP